MHLCVSIVPAGVACVALYVGAACHPSIGESRFYVGATFRAVCPALLPIDFETLPRQAPTLRKTDINILGCTCAVFWFLELLSAVVAFGHLCSKRLYCVLYRTGTAHLVPLKCTWEPRTATPNKVTCLAEGDVRQFGLAAVSTVLRIISIHAGLSSASYCHAHLQMRECWVCYVQPHHMHQPHSVIHLCLESLLCFAMPLRCTGLGPPF